MEWRDFWAKAKENLEMALLAYQSKSGDDPPRRQESIPDGKGGQDLIDYNPDGTVRSRERRTREFDSYGNLIKEVRSVAKGPAAKLEPVSVT